jgi:UDP-4-amino-4,6-dideoxy-N-acetyl-beta-L-altrosamine transaminase
MKPIPYGRHFISEEDIASVTASLKSDFLVQGPQIELFEKAMSELLEVKYTLVCSSGTAALHLCTMVLGVNETSKVITSPITFAASANCIRYCGGEVVFADIVPETVLIDINSVQKLLEASPKGTYQGIIPVDFAGYPVDMEKFKKLAEEYSLWIIEDACHAPGGNFIDSKGTKQKCGNGNFADLAIFSFHPVKHIACGEGGMITTNNKELYDKLYMLRSHGITKAPELMSQNPGGWYYEMQTLGYNYRMPDINAALGVSQVKRFDKSLERRREIAKKYDKVFTNTKIKIIVPPENIAHAYHLYVIQVENRKKLYDYLREKNIFSQVHYIPVHTLPYYQNLGYNKGAFPNAEIYYDNCLSIPMFPTLTDQEQDYVIECILGFYK